MPPGAAAEVALLKAMALRYVMSDPDRLAMQARQRELLTELAAALLAGAPRVLDPVLAADWAAAADDAARLRVVLDQVAVLTDQQAVARHARPGPATARRIGHSARADPNRRRPAPDATLVGELPGRRLAPRDVDRRSRAGLRQEDLMSHRSVLSLVALAAAALVGLAGCGSARRPPPRRPAAAAAADAGRPAAATGAVTAAARPTVSWSCGRCRPARSAWW